jgi:mRNA-degrading endonuclease toxin of MazEF toxin-antitoxin module
LPLTTEDIKHIESFSVFINNTPSTGLDYPSKVLCHNPFTLDKELRLKEPLGKVSSETLKKVKLA